MIEYQKRIQDFYKMRDTLIAEGYKDYESIIIYDKIEEREIVLEIIKKYFKFHHIGSDIGNKTFNVIATTDKLIPCDEYELLRKVLKL